jgi:hypothetical protein
MGAVAVAHRGRDHTGALEVPRADDRGVEGSLKK